MKSVRYLWVIAVLLFFHQIAWCQRLPLVPADSATLKKHSKRAQPVDKPYKVDSIAKKQHSPRKATLYSTFFPGLGQFYNRKYWKIPLAWAAVGIPTYLYFDNRNWYRKCQYAIAVIVTGTTNADSLNRVDPKLKYFVDRHDDNSLRSYRNEYRKDQDYSVLFFILFWGLNIVDATVDAHLMNFDISPQLSMHLGAPTSSGTGVGLALDWHKPRYKGITLP